LTTPALATCSYFEYKPEMGQAVRISLGLPRFWKTIPRLTELNPPRKYFDAKPWVFAPKYIEYLETITAYRIQEKIEGLQREFEGTLVRRMVVPEDRGMGAGARRAVRIPTGRTAGRDRPGPLGTTPTGQDGDGFAGPGHAGHDHRQAGSAVPRIAFAGCRWSSNW
jgi:hypothetical protein